MTTLPKGLTSAPVRSRPTMREVAALADVSIKTVSRVINGESGVAPAMTTRVMTAVERLDYRHDFAASALRRNDRRTATIGMVLEDLANPFSAAIHRAVEDVARERSVLVLAGSSDEDGERERSLVATFTSRRVDGLVIVPAGHDQSYLLNERKAGTAMVFIDRPPGFLDADAVVVDNVDGARRAVRHLLTNGHRRIAYLGDLHTIPTTHDRHAGYLVEMASYDVAVDPRLVELDLRGIEGAEAATRRMLLLEDPPTAIFSGQNMLTIGAIRALRTAGLHHEVALIGFDDILLADLLEPAVTVIAQDAPTIGRSAARALFRRLDGDLSPSSLHVIPTKLVVRGSGEIPGPHGRPRRRRQ